MAKKLSISRPAGTVAIIASVLLTLVSVMLAAGFMILLGSAFGQAFSGKSFSGQLSGLIVLAIGIGGCEGTRIAIEQRSVHKEQVALQSRLLRSYFHQGPGVLARRNAGSLVDMMTAGTEKIQRYRQAFLGSMIGAMLSPLLVLGLMALFIDPWCALILLAFVPLVPIIIFVFSKLTRKVSSKSRRRRNQLAAAYLDAISGLETLSLLGATDSRGEELAKAGEENRLSTMRLLAANQLILLVIDMGFNLLLLTCGFALTLWKVLNASWGSDITVIAPVVSMLGLTLLLLEPMNKIGAFFYVGMAGMANQRLVRAFLSGKAPSHPQRKTGKKTASTFVKAVSAGSEGQAEDAATSGAASAQGSVSTQKVESGQDCGSEQEWGSNQTRDPKTDTSEVLLAAHGVSFAYPGGKPVLSELNLKVKSGEWAAICGASGAGKSTLMELVKGNLLPSKGAINLQGRLLETGSREWFRRQSALVLQRTWIFSGTIRSNLMMVSPRASEKQLWDCLQQARLDQEISSFPQGLDTPVGEEGYALSGGQAQRLSLARALLSGRNLLLLDEPTSQIDLESEAAITQALAEVAREKTIVLLTHRASALANADRVLYLNNGALEEVTP
ncbi:ABC transporter ATP-binding protein/permease [Varibaculum prostatecancerukia]|uniref:ABC transporter ATP-binding protein/permease n=1 Tax=Varibaculum prostatecancerukia TaxID=2811781 RepID=UPI001C006D6D|nr:ATP-binding cassette domain-containing protein [Varibaculum prostatecancerukia]